MPKDTRPSQVEPGQKFYFERTFTVKDVTAFSEVSGDRGVHHVAPDSNGRLMLQGLLTATLPTKVGGDLNFIARSMTLEFLAPVFAGDTVRAEVIVDEVTKAEGHKKLAMSVSCTNQAGVEVLRGKVYGIIRAPSP